MRLKLTRYPATTTTVMAVSLWDTELTRIPDIEQYLDVLDGGATVVDRLHALLMIAKKVEDGYARTKKQQSEAEGGVHLAREGEAADTKATVSLSV